MWKRRVSWVAGRARTATWGGKNANKLCVLQSSQVPYECHAIPEQSLWDPSYRPVQFGALHLSPNKSGLHLTLVFKLHFLRTSHLFNRVLIPAQRPSLDALSAFLPTNRGNAIAQCSTHEVPPNFPPGGEGSPFLIYDYPAW